MIASYCLRDLFSPSSSIISSIRPASPFWPSLPSPPWRGSPPSVHKAKVPIRRHRWTALFKLREGGAKEGGRRGQELCKEANAVTAG